MTSRTTGPLVAIGEAIATTASDVAWQVQAQSAL